VWTASVILANDIPDMHVDKLHGIRNIAVMIGDERSAVKLVLLLRLAAAYAAFGAAVVWAAA